MNPSKENDSHDTVGESCLQLSFFFFMVVFKLLILWFSLSQGILVLDSNMQIAAGNNKIKLYNQS